MASALFVSATLTREWRQTHVRSLCVRKRTIIRTAHMRTSQGSGSTTGSELSTRARNALAAYAATPLYSPCETCDKAAEAVAQGESLGAPGFRVAFDELVREAQLAVEVSFPGIALPGGALYPEFRAKACWRDLRCFLATAGAVAYVGGEVRTEGIEALREVYDELSVPLPAMVVALRTLAVGIRSHGLSDKAAAVLDLLAVDLARPCSG